MLPHVPDMVIGTNCAGERRSEIMYYVYHCGYRSVGIQQLHIEGEGVYAFIGHEEYHLEIHFIGEGGFTVLVGC